ncbi:hypothetical protein F4781DRAFT_398090 [Annulohypoxylon bovei var. microspora]|nr:hypothetical protein F4781DRAFT_398090 [Annulohypoxylon bovei var. microspora]
MINCLVTKFLNSSPALVYQFLLGEMVTLLFSSSLRSLFLVLIVGWLNIVNAVDNWPITAPVANEVVPVGQPYTIRWNNNTQGPVSITLNYNEQPIVITSSTDNNGTFLWTPATVFAGDHDYYLSLCDITLDSSECSVTSDGRFHISSSSSSSSSIQTTTSSTSSTTSASTTTQSTTTATSTTSSSPTPTATTSSGGTSGLATGGVVGVAVGTTVAILALAALIFWAYKRTRRTTEPSVSQIDKHLPDGYNKPELSAETPSANDLMRIYGQFVGPAELHTERGPYELGGSSSR